MPEKQNKKSEEKVADSSNLITDNKESISEKIKPKDSETKTNKDQNIVKEEVTEVINPSKQIRKKKEIINQLRELVNGVENKDTFNKVKELQNTWKKIGQVESSKDKALWTTYNALLDRFYNNRSIYFELKDLI